MASSSGGSSGSSSLLTNSGMEEKKRMRMLSNRESARRSRMRKHKHQDDLTKEISQLGEKNRLIRNSLNLYAQNYLVLVTENSGLRTQVIELTSWLNSLKEIHQYLNLNNNCINHQILASEYFTNPWSSLLMNKPTMASPDLLQYY